MRDSEHKNAFKCLYWHAKENSSAAHRIYNSSDVELPILKLRLNAKILSTATISIKNALWC